MARQILLSMDTEEKNTVNFTKDRINFFNIYVFDLDGTLVNTLRSLQISTNIFLMEQGLPTVDDIEIFKYFVGSGSRVLVKKAYKFATNEDLSPECLEKYHERFLEIFSEHCLDEIELYDGIIETLFTLKKNKSLIICYTNKDNRLAKKCLEKLFPTNCYDIFTEIRGNIDGKNYKPDASFFNELRAKYTNQLMDFASPDFKYRKNYTDLISKSLRRDVEKSSAEWSVNIFSKKDANFIMVGDSDVDIDTAINANVFSCACTWGFRSKEELINKNPDFLIDKPTELLRIRFREL